MKVLVTGGEGFLGSNIAQSLDKSKHEVLISTRNKRCNDVSEDKIYINLEDLDDITLDGFDAVVHCAANVYSKNQDQLFFINAIQTAEFFKIAIRDHVKHFIFMSSVGVYGKSSEVIINVETETNPYNAYTQSKLEAEKMLIDLAHKHNISLSIIRAPMIYGKAAKGNYKILSRLISNNLPVPIPLHGNKRNFCSIQNITSFISHLIDMDIDMLKKINSYIPADNKALSLEELCMLIAKDLKKTFLYVRMPRRILEIIFIFLGKRNIIDSLFKDMRISNSSAKKIGWKPFC